MLYWVIFKNVVVCFEFSFWLQLHLCRVRFAQSFDCSLHSVLQIVNCLFSVGHWTIFSSLIYEFWLKHWHMFLEQINVHVSKLLMPFDENRLRIYHSPTFILLLLEPVMIIKLAYFRFFIVRICYEYQTHLLSFFLMANDVVEMSLFFSLLFDIKWR